MSEVKAQAVAPEYNLRALEAKDVFIVSKILSQIGLKEFKDAFDVKLLSDEVDDKSLEAIGISVFLDISQVLLGNLPKCEKDIYLFLSNLSGLDVKEIESLPMITFTEMIIDVVRKQEFMDFFRLVAQLFK